ncbi:MAG TPA: histidine--tRNA ligase [Opitutae bacterium]|nr:histidine--tRNA ligase [Opitutae bacterium]
MIQSLPGFREFYPAECSLRNHIFRVWRGAVAAYGFVEYDTPLLEPLELFTEKSGDEIVSQLFNFEDKGGRAVALRPEMTPSLVRLVGARVNSLRRPIKWFSIGEQFRFERPQKGRLRSFYQFNADILGVEGPGADAEAIALLIHILCAFGFKAEDFQLRLSDRDLWMYYLEAWSIAEEDRIAVLGIIDKMARRDREETAKNLKPFLADAVDDFLSEVEGLVAIRSLAELEAFMQKARLQKRDLIEERLATWRELLATLSAMGLDPYFHIDLSIVRGLAYYTGFVFEAFEVSGESRALAGGGRYDTLMEKITGQALPALGFAMGDVTLIDLLSEKGLLPKYVEALDVYVVTSGEEPRNAALKDIAALRAQGVQVEYALKPAGFNKQFKQADQLGARYALIYGEEELARGEVTIRDCSKKASFACPHKDLGNVLKAILEEGYWPE